MPHERATAPTPDRAFVYRLIRADVEGEELDGLIASLQDSLRRGQVAVAEALADAAVRHGCGLALETLAAARVGAFEGKTREVVESLLAALAADARFAAVAALGELPLALQLPFRDRLADLASSDVDADVKRSAGTLLRRLRERTARDPN